MHKFNRHDLVWLHLDAVKHAEYAGPAPIEPISALSALQRWVLGNYPLIVAQQKALPLGQVRLGLAEPPSWGKRRLAFLVKAEDIARQQSGPLLGEVVHQLPEQWQAGLTALVSGLQHAGVPAHVYGSSAIEVLTGLPCLTAHSDLDLLFKPATWADAEALCALLSTLRLSHPDLRIDGEVLNPAGDAVNWQELAMQCEQLLAKSNHCVRMMDLLEYQRSFASPARAV
jgi:phosphoribosyl-dephospho-CoA transferase